jgi:hypothetical protein
LISTAGAKSRTRNDTHMTGSGLVPGPPPLVGSPEDLAPQIGANEYHGPADSRRR